MSYKENNGYNKYNRYNSFMSSLVVQVVFIIIRVVFKNSSDMLDIKCLKLQMYDTIGAIHEVHRELGAGLNEYCYQEGLELELNERHIPYEREKSFHPAYHGKEMQASYRVDFICRGSIIVECKSVSNLTQDHRAQLFNYMRLLGYPCGILVNFSPRFVEIERYFYDKETEKLITTEGTPF